MLRWLASLGAIAGAVAAGAWMPAVLGASWSGVLAQLGRIGLWALLAVTVLWIAGLGCYTLAMAASLPGLTIGRALALNLAGSSAANVLPFGGVVGTGMNLAMIRSWRMSVRSFASSVAVLNLLNVVGKLVLPIAAGVVVAHDAGTGSLLGAAALWLGLALAVVIGLVIAGLVWQSWATALDSAWARVRRRDAHARLGPISGLRRDVRTVLSNGWRSLSLGMVGYLALQWALFAFCLHLAGVHVSIGAGFAAFAVERAVTLAVVTPAGAGLAEASAAGLLVALGASPVESAAGVVLYRLFVYAAEIPVGAAVFAGWAIRNLRRA